MATRVFYFLPGDIKLPRPFRPPPTALLRLLRTPPPTFVTLPAIALPAFDILPAVALPAFDIAPEPVLFIILPEEVILLDFILELPLAFPVEAAPSTEDAEAALASITPIDMARATTKALDTIFVIGH
jgi:hypothetical protein